MRMCHFGVQNDPFVMNKLFLVQTIVITFIYLLALFIVQTWKEFLWWIQSYKDAPFLGPKWSICHKQFFFWKTIKTILIYLLATFILEKFLKYSSIGSRIMSMCNFWAENDPFSQQRIFFRKPVNEPCFFHSCLSICQKSKSDISLLVKYWWLKNTEI